LTDLGTLMIDALRQQEIPDVVYHYTTPIGLLGLTCSKSVWATDVRYLNDSGEYLYTRGLCYPALDSRRQELDQGSGERSLFDEIGHVLQRADNVRLYAASFSENGNLLSQWRAYCPPTGGYSVGLAKVMLETTLGYKVIPCTYEPTLQRHLFAALMDHALAAYRNGWSADEQEPEHRIRITGLAIEFLQAFLVLAASFKSKAFQEEAEWRLIARPGLAPSSAPRYRVGRGGIVPYIDVALATNNTPLRLDHIIVGPNPHEEIARNAVISMLDEYGVQHNGVELAGIPYRAW
jgi:hypothetical protein